MTFTDDDLKRLKENKHFGHESACTVSLHAGAMEALIARMEAAETYIEYLAHRVHHGVEGAVKESAWRKAAGK